MTEPPVPGRFAPWLARARVLRTRIEAARTRHASLDLGLHVVEQDSSIGGGLLAGALAYRLFVLLLPSALLFVPASACTPAQSASRRVPSPGMRACTD